MVKKKGKNGRVFVISKEEGVDAILGIKSGNKATYTGKD